MKTISELEKKLDELPLLPMVIVRLLALDPNDEDYFDQLLELSQQDPTFALKIIRLSNSAMSAPVSPIITLRDAVIRLGVKSVAGLVTAMSAVRVFVPTKQGEKNLWIHSIQVAVAARAIARIAPSLEVDPEQAYLCGLMHDIGRFVLFDKESDELNLVDESNWSSPEQLVITEKEQYGFDHSELGHRICKKWGLPKIITNVVANHHIYKQEHLTSSDAHFENLIHIVQLADSFSVFMMINPGAASWETEIIEKELQTNCIQPSSSAPPINAQQLNAQVSKILDESAEIVSGLGVSG